MEVYCRSGIWHIDKGDSYPYDMFPSNIYPGDNYPQSRSIEYMQSIQCKGTVHNKFSLAKTMPFPSWLRDHRWKILQLAIKNRKMHSVKNFALKID